MIDLLRRLPQIAGDGDEVAVLALLVRNRSDRTENVDRRTRSLRDCSCYADALGRTHGVDSGLQVGQVREAVPGLDEIRLGPLERQVVVPGAGRTWQIAAHAKHILPVIGIEDTGTRTELERAATSRRCEGIVLVEYAVTVDVLDTDVVEAERIGSKRSGQCIQGFLVTRSAKVGLAIGYRSLGLRHERCGTCVQVTDDRLPGGVVEERVQDRDRERRAERARRCDLECRRVRRVRGTRVELDVLVVLIGAGRRELVAVLRRLIVVERVEVETRAFARNQVAVVAELVAVTAAQVQRRRDSGRRADAR